MKLQTRKIISFLTALTLLLAVALPAGAAKTPDAGTYSVKSTLSCFVDAMGGQEFGAKLYKGAKITVDKNGSAKATLSFGTGKVQIYSVTCDVFVDKTLSPHLGYYDKSGKLHKDAAYTVGTEKVNANLLRKDSDGNYIVEKDTYVTSMTFPVDVGDSELFLYLYINSQVMGVQFCNGKGTAASTQPDKATPYQAKLHLDWSSLQKTGPSDSGTAAPAAPEDTGTTAPDKTGDVSGGKPDSTQKQSATVTYEAKTSYEVEIPASIAVNSATRKGSYTVKAKSFSLNKGAFVTVTATGRGELKSGKNTVAFVNELDGGKLTKSGETLKGLITVTEDAVPGAYTGTVDFTINYFSGN